MQLPVIEFPAVGRMGIIGIVALIHIIFANLAVGGPVIAVVSEYLGIKRNDKRFDDLAKNLTVIIIIMMSLGGIFGVGLVALSIGLFPTFFAKTVNVFFWPLFFEVLLFVVEFGFLSLYRYTWDSLANRKGLHMTFGIIGVVGSWGSMIIINAAAAFMLTPGRWLQTQSLYDAIFNPSMVPQLLHRALGSLAVAGLITMLMVMGSKDKEFRSWGLRYAAMWAIVPTGLNIIPGLWNLFAIPEFSRGYILGGAPNITLTWVGAITMAAVAVVVLLLISRKPANYRNLVVILPFLLIVATIWGMGFTREAVRKPYLVTDAIYSNEIAVGQEDELRQKGSSGDEAPNGAELYARQCTACHTHTGFLGAIRASRRFDEGSLKELLRDPKRFGHPYMPPFFGTEEELDALVKYMKR